MRRGIKLDMNQLISDLSSGALRNGLYRDVLPEYYALEAVIEHNSWHDDQDAFTHSLKVFEGLEHILAGKILDGSWPVFEAYLSQKNGKQYSLATILKLATLFHDISKTSILLTDADGNTSCPGHEFLSAARVSACASRFDLDTQTCSRIETIVRLHGFVSHTLGLIHNGEDRAKLLDIFDEVADDVAIELLLFIWADVYGSDLDTLNPSLRNALHELIEDILRKRYAPKLGQ